MKDLYAVLQVHPAAEPAVIKAAYRKLSQLYHPDVNRSEDATRRMAEINEAWAVLSDPDRRRAYDLGRGNGGTSEWRTSATEGGQRKDPGLTEEDIYAGLAAGMRWVGSSPAALALIGWLLLAPPAGYAGLEVLRFVEQVSEIPVGLLVMGLAPPGFIVSIWAAYRLASEASRPRS